MAIRLRTVNGILVAICAARSVEKPGDVYLDDAQHHALAEKFMEDFQSEGYNTKPYDGTAAQLRALEEGHNPARQWWDSEYGAAAGGGRDRLGWFLDAISLGPVRPYWRLPDPAKYPPAKRRARLGGCGCQGAGDQSPDCDVACTRTVTTVRSWFRQMRAAEFEKDVATVSRESNGTFFIIRPELLRWTLFDTQAVVNWETAATYHDSGMFGIGWSFVDTFIEHGALIGNWMEKPPRPSHICPDCGGPARIAPMPGGYFGPGKGSTLYAYAQLLSPDQRYSTGPGTWPIWMCDACRVAGVAERKQP